MENTDLTVSGWSGGTLVQFQVRGGRANGWSQRACGVERAAGALAATPAGWRDFMEHNAELAARLARHPT